ncbi:MAG: iron chelate uptake ABC transporter family permease subunit [Candidatus Algichlamydia australiensis]|nr:iron chelate uptake ABC transporter family permease subunit [Chlamydiales bacterium]
MIFFDPITRGPLIGSMLMTLSSALIGVFLLIRKRSLVGEALSHAAYPGVVIAAFFFSTNDLGKTFLILGGALLFTLLAMSFMDMLKRFRFHEDAVLTLTLSTFLGVGILIASRLQFINPLAYSQIGQFLYGQVATMRDFHILLYGALTALVALFVTLFYHPLRLLHFNPSYAQVLGVKQKFLERVLKLLTALSIVIGIRTVGVVLMSGMLIAPAIAARSLSHRLSKMLFIAAGVGLTSGFLGNYLSTKVVAVYLPIGPMILLVAAAIALLALFFSPERGLFVRAIRIFLFHKRRTEENILKFIWKSEGEVTLSKLREFLPLPRILLILELRALIYQGFLEKRDQYRFTADGKKRAARIVRLHRLWELYLFHQHRVSPEKVHTSANEMEHIITPEVEKRLDDLLGSPEKDPHNKPIPKGEG